MLLLAVLLCQDAAASAGLEAQWLDLIRSAVQDQFRGKTQLCFC